MVRLAVRLKLNSPPRFVNTTETLRVVQGTAANTLLGTITANDYDGDSLTYSVSGADSTDFNSAFSLDSSGGRIAVKPGATIDFDTKAVYTVTLSFADAKAWTAAFPTSDGSGPSQPATTAPTWTSRGH